MSGNLKDWLKTAAVVVLAVALILVAFKVKDSSTKTIDSAIAQNNSFSTELVESKFTQYDGQTVTGSDVINAIKSLKGEVVCVIVNNGKQETQYLYNASLTQDLTDDLSAMLKEAKNKQNMNKYINPAATFDGEIIRDSDTDAITGIRFTINR